jgi:outer membrane protein assembly factor BamB
MSSRFRFRLHGRIVNLYIAVALATLSTVASENWPQFRGHGARGIGDSDQLPTVWGPDTNVAWRTAIPGRGWSSPIVSGQQVFLTTAISEGEPEPPKKGLYFGGERPQPSQDRHRWEVISADATDGRILWRTEVKAGVPATPVHLKNTYASETPATDGEQVFACFGSIGLYCLDFSGKVRWSQPFPARRIAHGWGTASSPVVSGGVVYVVNDNEEESFVAAFDARTGEEKWRVRRDEPSNWSTPFVWKHPGRTELVTTGRNKVRSYDLQGRLLWELKGMSSITIPTPFAADGRLYLCAGYVADNLTPNKPVYAVAAGATGDITLPQGEKAGPHIAWMEPNAAPYNPSPLVYQQRFYVLWDFGFLNCRDAATGREVYDKQRFNPQGTVAFTASPWAYRGHIFCLSEDGDTYVVPAGDTFEVARINSLNEMCMASPAMAGDRLFIRGMQHLFCLREADPE